MNPKRLTCLLFFTLAIVQFQAKAQTILTSPISGSYSGPATYQVNGDAVVSGDLTISGTVLTVTGNLTLNANIYLRKGGQLIQGIYNYPNLPGDPGYIPYTDTKSNNVDGGGILSVYQEGLADVHQFNYWCSPVGNGSLDASGNASFNVGMIKQPLTATTFASPTPLATAQDGISDPLQIAAHWINVFQSSTTYSQWSQVGTGTIAPGQGFTMKGTGTPLDTRDPGEGSVNNVGGNHQRYEFQGRPNNGNITSTTVAGKFTLIGNPYPSSVDLAAFFDDNNNAHVTDQVAYFWAQGPTTTHNIADYTGGYDVYAPYGFGTSPIGTSPIGTGLYVPATFYKYKSDGTYDPTTANIFPNPGNADRQYVPIGQGFMVKGDPVNGNGSVVMKNSFRFYVPEGPSSPATGFVGTGSVFSKKQGTAAQNLLPHIRFSTTYDNGAIGQMVQAFVAGSTEGIDKGKDVLNPNNGPTMVNLLVDDQRCVISAVPFDINRKIPLIFDNKAQANYKITVSEIVNLDQVTNVYLHDITADKYYDIKNNFYDLTLPQGMNYDQYEVAFQSPQLGMNDLTEKTFDIFQDNDAKKFVVSNPLQKELATCELYDLAGKAIFSKKKLGTQPSYEFSTAELSDGIYIVRVASQDNKTKAQKIVVRH